MVPWLAVAVAAAAAAAARARSPFRRYSLLFFPRIQTATTTRYQAALRDGPLAQDSRGVGQATTKCLVRTPNAKAGGGAAPAAVPLLRAASKELERSEVCRVRLGSSLDQLVIQKH